MTGTVGIVISTAVALAMVAVSAATWARRNLVLVTVKGHSMAPAYRDGDRVLLRRGGYRRGDVIMFRAPAVLSAPACQVDWLMKRVAAVAGDPVPADLAGHAERGRVPDGRLLVRSDAPGGLDSRQIGLIDDHDVIGVVSAKRVHRGRVRAVPLPSTDSDAT